MRISANFNFWFILVFCLSTPLMAQNAVDCDQLRDKITQLERMDMNAMSPSIRQLHKQSILKLSEEFSTCLQQDISATVSMLGSVAGTSAAPPVAEKLLALKKEKSDTDAEITLLRETSRPDAASQRLVSTQPGRAPVRNENEDNDGKTKGTNRDNAAADTAVASPNAPLSTPLKTTVVQGAAVCVPPVPYTDAPALLTDVVDRDVADAVEKNNAARAVASISKMVLYTILDSASSRSSEMVRSLEAYQYLGETARTDKQLGSSPNSNGAVSAIEKP